MDITFLGAAGMVTGSSYLLSSDKVKLLVDLGMFQGDYETESLNQRPLPLSAPELSAVFLTHAHLDHCGRLPILYKNGFRGNIYATAATREIAEAVLLDAAHIMAGDDDKPVLYTKEQVLGTLNLFKPVSYDEVISIPGFEIIYKDAGHILGSASIIIKNLDENKTYAFSGDLGNSPEDLVKPIEFIDSADTVVMESTYGDTIHPNDNPDQLIQSEINTVEQTNGTLLIPSFSVERTQVLLHKLKHFKGDGRMKKGTPVYLDSPMGETVTEIYKKFPDLYGEELRGDTKAGDPFMFSGLQIVSDRRESQRVSALNGPRIIIAGSGMMTGGRILEHALRLLPRDNTRLLIVGFQAEHTVGRALEEGAKEVQIYGQKVNVKANVTSIHSMSAHADQPILTDWLNHIKNVSKVFLVHGEDGPREALKNKILESKSVEILLPKLEETYKM